MRQTKLFLAPLLIGVALLTVPALADIPPPNSCQAADEGAACDTAIVNGKMGQPGTCQKDMCTRATPQGSMSYECYLCNAAAGGTGGGGGTGGISSEAGAAGIATNEGGAVGEGGSPPTAGSGGVKAQGGAAAKGGASSGGASSAGTTSTGGKAGGSKSDSSGCSVSTLPVGGGSGVLASLVALSVAAWRRRRARRG